MRFLNLLKHQNKGIVMVQKISRRFFLKAGVTAACSVVATSPVAKAAKAMEKGEPIATLLDISKCIGCEECVYACKETNGWKQPEPEKPFPRMYPNRVPVEDFSEKRDVTEQLNKHFGDKLYRTVIPRNVRLAEAPSHGLPALMYDKSSRGAQAYLALAGEMIRRESGNNMAANG